MRFAVNVLTGSIESGGVELAPTTQQRAIVVALALHPSGLSSERLIDMVYGDTSHDVCPEALRAHIFRLRRRLGSELVISRGGTYKLGNTVRVIAPGDGLTMDRDLRHMTDCELQDLSRLGRSLRTPLCGGLEYYDWHARVAAGYQQIGRNVTLAVARELASRGQHAEAIRAATELTLDDQCDEEAWEQIIRSHLSQGQRAAAIHSFRFLSASLSKDLGIAPSNSVFRLLHN